MRRRAPQPLASPLAELTRRIAPATTLARAQEAWPAVAGAAAAAESTPVTERAGTVTVACRSAVWAGELDLLSAELLGRLNGALGEAGAERPVRSLRFVTQSA